MIMLLDYLCLQDCYMRTLSVARLLCMMVPNSHDFDAKLVSHGVFQDFCARVFQYSMRPNQSLDSRNRSKAGRPFAKVMVFGFFAGDAIIARCKREAMQQQIKFKWDLDPNLALVA